MGIDVLTGRTSCLRWPIPSFCVCVGCCVAAGNECSLVPCPDLPIVATLSSCADRINLGGFSNCSGCICGNDSSAVIWKDPAVVKHTSNQRLRGRASSSWAGIPAHSMIKVLHIITELGLGGAPTMLCRLLSKMDSASFENEVISLTNLGGNAAKIRGAGVPVRALGMKSSIPNPFPAARLFQWISKSKPHVVQTWMYHANLLGGLAAHLAGNIPVVWGIHHVDLSRQGNKLRTIWTAKGCARISRWLPRCVVFCSQSALLSHMKLGYAAKRLEVIPNGLDVHEFKADPSARLSVRQELGIGAAVIVIGRAARFHPLKDHRNFIKAATRLRAMIPEVHFVLCGIDVNYQTPELSKWILET